jgi:hypothetical protein
VVVVVLAVVAVAVVGGGVLLFVAGGDGDEEPPPVELSAEEQEYADALTEADPTAELDPELSQCLSAVTVDVVGIDVLRNAATPAELSNDSGDTLRVFGVELDEPRVQELARRFDECGDLWELFAEQSSRQGAPTDMLTCLRRHLTEEELAYSAAAGYVGSEELSDAVDEDLDEALQPCVSDSGGLFGLGGARRSRPAARAIRGAVT